MIEAKKREMSQQLAELEDGSDGPDEFEGNIICKLLQSIVYNFQISSEWDSFVE